MKKTYLFSIILAAMIAGTMTGCGEAIASENLSAAAQNETSSVSSSEADSSSESETVTVKSKKTKKKSAESVVSDDSVSDKIDSGSSLDKSTEDPAKVIIPETTETAQSSDEVFTKRDLEQTADTSDSQSMTVSDNSTIDITEEGVYVISGSAKNCTIRVEADKNAKIQLVLDGVSITNDDFPAIYVVSADKIFVTTTDSENTLTVSGQFRADEETNTDAVIFSKDDIVLNGTGTLNVTSTYGNGITGKDDMKITGGTYNVGAALDAFEANDSISVSGGVFNIRTNKDGFHCENDSAEGTIYISGGTVGINALSDGIQACALLQIDGGTFDITAAEGLEATYILINDGNITINANDDGINASNKSGAYSPTIEINGGELTISMSGSDIDGIDANGSIIISGGRIDISYPQQGPNGAFDYDGTATYNGGTIIINGEQVDSIPQSMMGGGMRGGHGRF